MTEQTESKVLSTEEMDALAKVAQEKENDLSKIVGQENPNREKVNEKVLMNISELSWAEIEKALTSFLRKKVTVKLKSTTTVPLVEALEGKTEKHVYTIFKLAPTTCFGLIVINLPLLHQAINFLYGGQSQDNDPVIESPGKIGLLIAEKIGLLGMDGFSQACKEYGTLDYALLKTVTLPNLITKFNQDDQVYVIDMSVFFGEVETEMTIVVDEKFFNEFVPDVDAVVEEALPVDNGSWRSTIESQVIDSYVTVNVTLPEVSIKASELLALKDGDLIPISDPVLVYLCLNNSKLFTGNAAQVNSNRVVKIVNEI